MLAVGSNFSRKVASLFLIKTPLLRQSKPHIPVRGLSLGQHNSQSSAIKCCNLIPSLKTTSLSRCLLYLAALHYHLLGLLPIGETSGANSSKMDFVLLICSHAFDSKQLAQNMTFIIDIQSCFTTLDVCNDCRVMGKTHTGALQVAVPFMCWHSGWHAKQVLFIIASRGSLQKTNNKTPRFKQLHVK